MSNFPHAEPSSESLSTKVVTEVAEAKGISPMDIQPPLHDTIDPSALDTLFANKASRVGRISFNYNGCEVTVESSGEVNVQVISEKATLSD